MTRIRTLLAAAAINSNSPALIISRVNDEMRRKNESCMFAAIWYAVVDLKTRELCFCNAGYNPPFIAHGEGDFLLHRNTVPTTPVGAFHPEETLYTEQHLTLDEGFSCFLYSDSIVETGGRDGEHFGQQRLARLLNSMKYDSCSRVINAVQQGISVFSENTPPQDDIAMMMIRIKTPGSETT
jgi:sigma-B regulation protein RsbU (phosphoserine phosphatase)